MATLKSSIVATILAVAFATSVAPASASYSNASGVDSSLLEDDMCFETLVGLSLAQHGFHLRGAARAAESVPALELTAEDSEDRSDLSSFAQASVQVKPASQDNEDARCLLAALARPSPAGGSNGATDMDMDLYQPEILERALYKEVSAVLAGKHTQISHKQFEKLMAEFKAVFPSLPKNQYGAVDHKVARHALFQHFLRRHGWYVRSFNPAGESQIPASRGEALRSEVPEHLLDLITKKLEWRGLGLNELTAVAAVLEHLIQGDLEERVRAAYATFNFSVGETFAKSQAVRVLQIVMAHYVSIEHRSGYALTLSEAGEELLQAERYVNWWKIKVFIQDAIFEDATVSFEQAVEAAQLVADRFEEFSRQECGQIRKSFLALPGGNVGRVRLADFHGAVLKGDAGFAESTEYLRKLGAVDETSQSVPQILLPNYMASPSNCMATTSFFDLCCPSQCESIMEVLEQSIRSPSATADQVVAVVDGRLSLPSSAVPQLEEISRAHGGRIPLHSFAFADWMHGAFPTECPRPRPEHFGHAQGEWTDGDDSKEVPEATQAFQAVAELKTLTDIVASKEELEMEKLELEALEQDKSAERTGLSSTVSRNGGETSAWNPPPCEESAGVCAIAALAESPASSPDLDVLKPERLEKVLFSELEAVLAGSHTGIGSERLPKVMEQMKAMFASLPKNEYGRVEHVAARYALFQRFSRRRGWVVHSLNPAGEAQTPSSSGEALRGKVPMHLLSLLEAKQAVPGLGLRELAAIVATLEHLISGDLDQRLKAAYYAHRWAPDHMLSQPQVADVIKTLMAHFVSLEHRSGYALSPEAAQKERADIERSYPGWRNVVTNIERALRRHAVENHGALLSFANAKNAVQEVMDGYEEQSASECRDIKQEFSRMPNGTSGRVLLADLHRAALEGEGTFRESAEYLRKVGALDESDPSRPHVLLPNYVYSPSNCLGTTSFYDVCCPSECDLIMEHLEQRLQSSEANVVDISNALGTPSWNFDQPEGGALWPFALTQLEDLAGAHGGVVPLHGHSFAAWLHVAFPRECPQIQAKDFMHTHSSDSQVSVRSGHEEEDEVPGTALEYQDVADLKSIGSIVASQEELQREVEVLGAVQAMADKANISISAIEGDDLSRSSLEQTLHAAMPPAFDVASFAQTSLLRSEKKTDHA